LESTHFSFLMSDLSLCVTGNSLYLRSHSLRNYSKISRLFRQNIGLFLLSNLLLCRIFLMMTTYLLIGLVFALQPRLYFGLTPFLSNFGLNMIHWDPLISDLTKSLFDGWPFVTLRDQQRTFLLDSHLSDSFQIIKRWNMGIVPPPTSYKVFIRMNLPGTLESPFLYSAENEYIWSVWLSHNRHAPFPRSLYLKSHSCGWWWIFLLLTFFGSFR
jgi:hypothetical protein